MTHQLPKGKSCEAKEAIERTSVHIDPKVLRLYVLLTLETIYDLMSNDIFKGKTVPEMLSEVPQILGEIQREGPEVYARERCEG